MATVHHLGFVWIIHEGHLIVFITVQNMVAIDLVLSKI